MTLFELNRFAKGAALRSWEQTAQICALIHNINRKKGARPITPDQYNPFVESNKKKVSKPIDKLFDDFGPTIDFKRN